MSETLDELEALIAKNQLSQLTVVPTYRKGRPRAAGNIDGWMVCEQLPEYGNHPDEEDPVASGLSRNAADFFVSLVNSAPSLIAAARRAERMEAALKPFAEAAEWFDAMPTDDVLDDREPLHFAIDGEDVQHATIGDLRRARAALTPEGAT